METRHPVGGSFGTPSEFPAICNHCVVMAVWIKSQDLEILWAILRFLEETTTYSKIFKILLRKFTWRHRSSLLCSNVVKFVRREIGEIVRYFLDQEKTKFELPFKLSLLRGSRQKSANARPQQCAHSAPDFIQIGSLSAEL